MLNSGYGKKIKVLHLIDGLGGGGTAKWVKEIIRLSGSIRYEFLGDEFGWKTTVGLRQGLKKTLDWYLKCQDGIKRAISGEYQDYYTKVYESGWNG